MASLVQVIRGNTGSTSSSISVSGIFSGAQTAGNINILVIWVSKTGTNAIIDPTSVVDSNNGAYTLAGSQVIDTTGNTAIWIYYRPNIALASAGTNTVTVTWSFAQGFPIVIMEEWSGIATSSPLDATGSAATTGSTGNGSVSVTTTNTNDVIVTGFSNFSNGWTGAPGTGFTIAYDDTASSGNLCDYKVVSSTGTYTDTPTPAGTNTDWVAAAAAFKQSGGGSISPTVTGNIAVTGVPVVTLQYETDLTGISLVTGAVSPLLGVSPALTAGTIGVTGALNPSLMLAPLIGTIGVTGSVNTGAVQPALSGVVSVTGAVVPVFSPINLTLTGSIGVHGSVTTNLPPGPVGGNRAVPFPFYIYGLG